MGMTIDRLALCFRQTLREHGVELANAVRDVAVERYGRKFVLTALKRQRQMLNAEKNKHWELRKGAPDDD
jgi:hypothetical protein